MWKYNVYYDGVWLHEETDFYTAVDAEDDAGVYIESKIDDWVADGVEYEKELFDVEIEYEEE